jgi:molecular chaperone GrpE
MPENTPQDRPPDQDVEQIAPLEDAPQLDVFSEVADEDIVNLLSDDLSMADLQKQLYDANEHYLRATAELENFRKRARREHDEQLKYASAALMFDILAVGDNLRRAIDAAHQSSDAAGLLEGVKMVSTQLDSVLEKHNCKRIEAAGAEFDPNLHEAIAQLPTPDVEPGKVAQVTVEGFTLFERVVRPSQVIVAAAAPAAPDETVENTLNADGE